MLGNQLKKPAKVREIIMAAIAMVFIFVASLQNFVFPKQQEVVELSQQLQTLKDSIEATQKHIQAVKDATAQLATTDTQSTKPDTIAEDPRLKMLKNKKQKYNGISDFFSDLSGITFRGSVEIDSIKHDPSVDRGGYHAIKFTLLAHGDFQNILSFIKKMENVPALVSLDMVLIDVGKGDQDNISLSLTGTFYQLEDENA